MIEKWLPLIIGGVSGTVARYVLSGLITRGFGSGFPYGTMSVNLLGCFLLGLFAILIEGKGALDPHAKLLLLVGFCGAFTTFSTFILETAQLMTQGQNLRAFTNLALSVILGFVALKAGTKLGTVFV